MATAASERRGNVHPEQDFCEKNPAKILKKSCKNLTNPAKNDTILVGSDRNLKFRTQDLVGVRHVLNKIRPDLVLFSRRKILSLAGINFKI